MPQTNASNPTNLFQSGKLLVSFHPTTVRQTNLAVHTQIGAILSQHIPELNLDIVDVEPGKELEYIDKYKALKNVRYVELNYYGSMDYTPNDPYYKKKVQTTDGMQNQWGLRRINTEPAWDIAHSLSPSVKIAVLDSGIDPNHPDLAGKFVDPINFTTSDPNDYIDKNGHGTFIAGIAAAVTDNKTGIAGASFNSVYIIPVKITITASTVISQAVQGIVYAIQKGAKVISMSFVFNFYSEIFQEAIDLAWNKGIVCVAAAGNWGSDGVCYPGGSLHSIAVSATTQSNSQAFFTNWGIQIGIAAPGVDILSTSTTYPCELGYLQYYDAAGGTSYACPFVSSVAAMMFAVNPDLTNQDVYRILQQSARAVTGNEDDEENATKSWNLYYGYGLLDAGKAVCMAKGYHYSNCGLGSFYGQVIDKETGHPMRDVIVKALKNGVSVRQYMTKSNVIFELSPNGSDGMFRLWNLAEGTYSIYAAGREIQTVAIEAGTDTLLKLYI